MGKDMAWQGMAWQERTGLGRAGWRRGHATGQGREGKDIACHDRVRQGSTWRRGAGQYLGSAGQGRYGEGRTEKRTWDRAEKVRT